MPLRESTVRVLFGGGIDTKTDSKSVIATKLLTLENGVFYKNTEIIKRNGYESYSKRIGDGTDTYGEAIGLATRDQELILFDTDNLYTQRANVDRWQDQGELCVTTATDINIAHTGGDQTQADQAVNGEIRVVAWVDTTGGGGVWASVHDSSSNALLLTQQLDVNGQLPRVIASGSNVLVTWINSIAAHTIFCAVINPTRPTDPIAATPVPIVSDWNTGGGYSVCSTTGIFDSNPAILVWASATGGYSIAYIHQSGLLGSPLTGLPSATLNWQLFDSHGVTDLSGPIAVTFDKLNKNFIGVAYAQSDISVAIHSPTTLTQEYSGPMLLGSGTWQQVTCEFDGKQVLYVAVQYHSSYSPMPWQVWSGAIDVSQLHTTGVFLIYDPSTRILLGHKLISQAFHDNGQVYIAIGHESFAFPYVAVVRLSSPTFGGTKTVLCGQTLIAEYEADTVTNWLPGVNAVDADVNGLSRQHEITNGYRITLSSTNLDQYSEVGIRLTTFDFLDDAGYQSAQLGAGLYIAGSVPQHYDGSRVAEAQFLCAPDFQTATPGSDLFTLGSGGSLTVNSTYGYLFLFEEVDSQGEIHRGATSVQYDVVNGTNTSVTFTIPTLHLTSKKMVRVAVFRSIANDDTNFYRITDLDPTHTTGANCYLLNDPTVDTLTFVDHLSDADCATRELIYTDGGVQSNDPTPMNGAVLVGGKTRLFYTDPSNPLIVRFTNQIADATGVEFVDDFFVTIDPFGGPITGLYVQDDAVLAFKESAVFFFGGPGPDSTGNTANGLGFTAPELITSDVGSISANSIANTPLGVTFQSAKGLYLIDRSRQVQSIGDDAYGYNGQTITRATLMPDRKQIVFLTDTATGSSLLWDYERQSWSTWTNHHGVDAVVLNGAYYYLRVDGRVFKETIGKYADGCDLNGTGGQHIKLRIGTAWIKMAGYLQAWQKILRAQISGTYQSAHDLRFSYALDYNEGLSNPYNIDMTAKYDPDFYGAGEYGAGAYGGAGTGGTRYQESIHLNKKCQAIRFMFEDVETYGAFGASYELAELLLTGGTLGSRFPVGAARQS